MGIVYSTPFIHMHSGATQEYTVADGYKAVVRCITACNNSVVIPESAGVYATDYDIQLWTALMDFIGGELNQTSQSVELRYVMLPGETLKMTGDDDVDGTVSGYLLSIP